MPFSDWRSFAPLGIGLAVLAVVYLVPTLADHYQNAGRAEYAATQEYEISKRVAPFGPSTQGPHASPAAYREEWRAERDLRAQEAMAWWAKLLFWITTAGVGLVAFTLLETRRAAQAAIEMVRQSKRATVAAEASVAETRRTGEAQVQAYVSIERTFLQIGKISGGSLIAPQITFVVTNKSQSPADQISAIFEIHFVIRSGSMRHKFIRYRFWSEIAAGETKSLTFFSGDHAPSADILKQISDPEGMRYYQCSIHVNGQLQYQTVFQRVHKIQFNYDTEVGPADFWKPIPLEPHFMGRTEIELTEWIHPKARS